MFYAHIVLAKKGPLARIWLAAHWDKKLTKAHVFETNIEQSIDGIMQPKVKLALRTSGHLLLGVVRIYSRKAKYLLADCNEAFVKIKMAFRPGIVDLPEEHREAAVNAITLPEVFHDFDTALPELNDVDIEAQFSINQSRADEITMREEYGSLSMNIHDDGFGDTNYGFDPESNEVGRIGTELFNDALDDNVPMDTSKDDDPVPGTSKLMDELHSNEGFGNEYENPVPGLYEVELFSEAPVTRPNILPDIAEDRPAEDSDFDDGHFDDGAPSPPSSENSMPGSPMPASSLNQLLEADNPVEEQPAAPEVVPTEKENIEPNAVAPLDEESFALAPVDSSVIKGFSNKSKRKRKLIIDEVKNISGDEMKNQLANTSDIVTTLDLAPPTKRLMFWKETGGVEKLFALPSRELPNEVLFKNYQRHLVTNTVPVEDFSRLGPADVLIVAEQHPEEIASPVVKRRRKQRTPEPVAPLAIPTLPEIPQTPIEPDQSVEPVRHASNSLDFPNSFAAAQGSRADVEQSGITNDSVPGGSGVFDQMAGAITPSGLDHGGMTPHHDVIETIDNIPNLPADQVQSILNASYPNYGFDNQGGLDDKISHDWDGDYDFPASPPPPTAGTAAAATDEQQGIDETVEQFEERVLNKRAAALFVTVRAKMQKRDCLYLSEMTVRNNKKQAAQKFYSLLVLKKFQALDLKQGAQYSDIQITRGPLFENPTL